MNKYDYTQLIRERLEHQVETLRSLKGTSFAKPQTACDIWRYVLDVKTLCALTDTDYTKSLAEYSEKIDISEADMMTYAKIGEWVTLDRSTRELTADEYDDFWGNPENQPNIHELPVKDEDDSVMEMLNEMWKL